MKPKRISLALALALSIGGAVWDRTMAQQKPSTPEALLGSALHQEEAEGNLEAAIALYKRLISEHGTNRSMAAKAQLHIGLCYEKLGSTEARKAYQQVVNEYADQPEEARLARARLDALGGLDRTMRVRRVWEGPFHDLLGAPTRDGRYLTIQEGATTNLAVRDLATGQLRLLTKKDRGSVEFAMRSMPSPDGKMVAYVWYSSKIHYHLRIVGWDGSNPRVLCADPAFGYMEVFDWSPDGKNILVKFQQQDKGSQIALVSVAEGSIRILKSFDREAPQRARFSPDGQSLLFIKQPIAENPLTELWQIPVKGREPRRLELTAKNMRDLRVHPDGHRVAYTVAGDKSEVWAMENFLPSTK